MAAVEAAERPLRILADNNLPGVEAACAPLGELTCLPGESIGAAEAAQADVLLLRSVTRVDERLLRAHRPLFVGTATSGFDHVDRELLDRRGITFAYAPGCNAASVAEWCTAALLLSAQERGVTLASARLGVIGVGRVGREVVRCGRALGLQVLLDDPPRQRREGSGLFTPRAELLASADIVSLHVPLTTSGPDATAGLVDAEFLAALRPGATLINSSRGAVVEGPALLDALRRGRPAAALLDVWPGEPRLDPALARHTTLATPHIAGHSLDGKLAGTRMLIDALCARLGRPSTWRAPPLPTPPALDLEGLATPQACLAAAALAAYPVAEDDGRLRAVLGLPADERAEAFGALRRGYWPRRGFGAWRVRAGEVAPSVRAALAGLGFQVS